MSAVSLSLVYWRICTATTWPQDIQSHSYNGSFPLYKLLILTANAANFPFSAFWPQQTSWSPRARDKGKSQLKRTTLELQILNIIDPTKGSRLQKHESQSDKHHRPKICSDTPGRLQELLRLNIFWTLPDSGYLRKYSVLCLGDAVETSHNLQIIHCLWDKLTSRWTNSTENGYLKWANI